MNSNRHKQWTVYKKREAKQKKRKEENGTLMLHFHEFNFKETLRNIIKMIVHR